MQVPQRRAEKNRKRDTGSFYLTPQGLQQLKNELARLERGLPALIQEVMRTKENGDLSENFEYQDAKHTLRNTHGRIASLTAKINGALIITKSANTSGMVEIGSTVVLETNGKRVTYEILGSQESDPAHGRISDRSPLGALLLGRIVGDEIALTTPSGSRTYTIVKIQ